MSGNLISRGGCLAYNPKLKERAREMRRNMTEAEKKIWNHFLRNHELTFHRQKPINHFIVDFYCSASQLVIEIDGEAHFTEEGKIKDMERTTELEGYGLKVLRFTNQEVIEKFDYVCKKIDEEIQRRNPDKSEKPPLSPFEKGGSNEK